MDALRAQLAGLAAEVAQGAKQVEDLRLSVDRVPVELGQVQQRQMALEEKIGKAFEMIHETHREARLGRDLAGSLKTSMEVVLATLEAQAKVLRKLLRRRPPASRRPKLKVVRGGRASSPGPGPRRRQ